MIEIRTVRTASGIPLQRGLRTGPLRTLLARVAKALRRRLATP